MKDGLGSESKTDFVVLKEPYYILTLIYSKTNFELPSVHEVNYTQVKEKHTSKIKLV